MYDFFVKIMAACWQVLAEMSPYLLFGFLIAGVLSVCISADWIRRQLGRKGLGPVIKASLFGIPLPLCSCGVIPVSASIRRSGASKASTTSFLLSTPQTGVDSIAITYALLGPVFAIFRPIAALLTGVLGGCLVQLLGDPKSVNDSEVPKLTVNPESENCQDSCCSKEKKSGNVILRIFSYGFLTLPRDIGLSLPLGILIAGVISAAVPKDSLPTYIGSGLLSILLMMLVGVPIYVCATASVPIAAGLMHMGVSPGAALAFLIAGPVTNAATLTTIWKLLGKRTTFLYLGTVGISAVAGGLMLDWLTPLMESVLPSLSNHIHEHSQGDVFHNISAVALLLVMGYAYYHKFIPEKYDKSTGNEKTDNTDSSVQERLELKVSGMTCSHCVEHVQKAVAGCTGVQSVEVKLKGGQVVVNGVNYSHQEVMEAIEQLGYIARKVR
ncbi:SO_0444 family Cu/Zn efflux transporter [Planctomycetota bacterium]